MDKHTETRWAIKHVGMNSLLGKFCWPLAKVRDGFPTIPTFKTRKLAREAQTRMCSYSKCSKIVKVKVTVEEVPYRK